MCYQACGFEAVGATAGFGRASREFYQRHDDPKQVYLREVHPRARTRLRKARLPEELAIYEAEVPGPGPFRAPALETMLERLAVLPNARRGHELRHPASALCWPAPPSRRCWARAATGPSRTRARSPRSANSKRWAANPMKPMGGIMRRAIPRFSACSSACTPARGAALVGGRLTEQEFGALAQLAVDGKVLRGSGRHDGKPLQLLSAVPHHLRRTLDQIFIAEKSNRIPALQTAVPLSCRSNARRRQRDAVPTTAPRQRAVRKARYYSLTPFRNRLSPDASGPAFHRCRRGNVPAVG